MLPAALDSRASAMRSRAATCRSRYGRNGHMQHQTRPGGRREAQQGGGQMAGRPVRAGTRRLNYSETRRRGPRGPRKVRSAAYMDKSSDTGGRVTLKRAIAVSDVTIERIVGGAYEFAIDMFFSKCDSKTDPSPCFQLREISVENRPSGAKSRRQSDLC